MARPQLKTQRGYDFYEVASALQKAIRRGDTKVAGYFGIELFPRYHNYVWKRLLTVSAEDCAGVITQEIKALHESFLFVNKGKKADQMGGRVFISKAIILLCMTKHNRDADLLTNYIYDLKAGLSDKKIESYLDEVRQQEVEMPDYVQDVHTLKGKQNGKTKEDFFREEQEALFNEQTSLFDDMKLIKY